MAKANTSNTTATMSKLIGRRPGMCGRACRAPAARGVWPLTPAAGGADWIGADGTILGGADWAGPDCMILGDLDCAGAGGTTMGGGSEEGGDGTIRGDAGSEEGLAAGLG